jgi:hypothetical protein
MYSDDDHHYNDPNQNYEYQDQEWGQQPHHWDENQKGEPVLLHLYGAAIYIYFLSNLKLELLHLIFLEPFCFLTFFSSAFVCQVHLCRPTALHFILRLSTVVFICITVHAERGIICRELTCFFLN